MQKRFLMSAPAVGYLIDERRVSVDKSKKLGEGTFGVVYLATLNGVLNVVAKVQSLLFTGAYQAAAWNLELNFVLSYRKYHMCFQYGVHGPTACKQCSKT